MFENALKAAIIASTMSFTLVACTSGTPEDGGASAGVSPSADASIDAEAPENGTEGSEEGVEAPEGDTEESEEVAGESNTERLADNDSDEADVNDVRAAVDAFNESVGEVDLEAIYEDVDMDGDESWEEYKVMIYENARPHIGEVMAHTNYAGNLEDDADTASPEDVDHVLLATSHVSFFQYTFAFFDEEETPQVVFDNDYIITDGETAEVFIVPNPVVIEEVMDTDPQEFIDDHIDDQRQMKLSKDEDGTWVIDADTLAHELPEDILETGELPTE